jgi:cell volume regulation protein A
MDITTLFLLAGGLLILGFLGDYLFKRTGIPDILILIAMGFVIGPLTGVVNIKSFVPIAPLFASLALLIILFEGGLHMNLYRTLKGSPRAMILAIVGTITSMALTATFTVFVMGWDVLTGLLLGAIVSGTSSAIVIPIISRISGVNQKVSTVLSLESVFTDALVVVISLTLIQFITSPPSTNGISILFSGIASQFSVGIVAGLLVGIIWLRIMKEIRGSTYNDVITLAVALVFYALVQNFGGSGPIFALTFGLVLANGYVISKMLRLSKTVEADKMMKKFQSQISFLIRTFFFVYLGLIITLQDPLLVIYGLAITVLLVVGRLASVYVTSIRNKTIKQNTGLLTIMLPRGLAAAVVAQIVSTSEIANGQFFSDIVITVIVMTVIITSVGQLFFKRLVNSGRD